MHEFQQTLLFIITEYIDDLAIQNHLHFAESVWSVFNSIPINSSQLEEGIKLSLLNLFLKCASKQPDSKVQYLQLIEKMNHNQTNVDHLELKETSSLYKALINYENSENPQFLEEIFSEELNHNASQQIQSQIPKPACLEQKFPVNKKEIQQNQSSLLLNSESM